MSLLSPTLEAFWAIVQVGTVQKASNILKITQTGVTQRLRSLEKQLGVSLFVRSRTGMRLTQEGQALLDYVKLSLEIEGVTLSKIQNSTLNHNIELRISGTTSFLQSRVTPFLSSFISSQNFTQLELIEFDQEQTDLISKLKSQNFDFALVEKKFLSKELMNISLGKIFYNLFFLNTKESKLKPIIIVLNSDYQILLNYLNSNKLQLDHFSLIKVDSIQAAYTLFTSSAGLFFSTLNIVNQLNIKLKNWKNLKPLSVELFLCTPKSKYMPKYKTALIELLKKERI